tara:strand:- start:5468 stop:6178 length:711 start_codon:yes stop_codon:yes gene_type:complete
MRKHVLILGGSSDIGVEVIKKFFQIGWKVTAHCSKNKNSLKKLNNLGNLEIVQIDFSKIKGQNFLNIINKKFKTKFDSFINLVGYTDNKSFDNTGIENITKTLSINFIFPLIIQKLLVKKMIKQKWGRILNCSGIGVKFGGGKFNYNYALSQHCREFIPSLYKSWARENVLINNIRIGVTDTKLHSRVKKNMKNRVKLIPIKRMASPKEMAEYIINLSTETNTYITGQTITVAGGE